MIMPGLLRHDSYQCMLHFVKLTRKWHKYYRSNESFKTKCSIGKEMTVSRISFPSSE